LWLVPAIVAGLLGPSYVVPENTLPPAPWTVKPDYLAWKQDAALAAFGGARVLRNRCVRDARRGGGGRRRGGAPAPA
jgi:hypothetical protein